VTSEKNTIKLKELFGLENGKFDSYTEIERKVKHPVLPHSESAKRAKEESEAPALEIPQDQKIASDGKPEE